jgi:hypothetical protein
VAKKRKKQRAPTPCSTLARFLFRCLPLLHTHSHMRAYGLTSGRAEREIVGLVPPQGVDDSCTSATDTWRDAGTQIQGINDVCER